MKREFIRGDIWLRIDRSGGDEACWPWTGALTTNGYGQVVIDGKKRTVHRVAYEQVVGPILAGMELDRLCRNRPCANPRHMEQVTHRENTLRGETIAKRAKTRTHCPQGHEYAGENLAFTKSGDRRCRTCQRAYTARLKEERRDLYNANRNKKRLALTSPSTIAQKEMVQ